MQSSAPIRVRARSLLLGSSRSSGQVSQLDRCCGRTWIRRALAAGVERGVLSTKIRDFGDRTRRESSGVIRGPLSFPGGSCWYSYHTTPRSRQSLSAIAAATTPDSSILAQEHDEDTIGSDEAAESDLDVKDMSSMGQEFHRLQQIRNIGIFAHVDAGKTTVTERMLALAGLVDQAGSVDEGNTVTDYLPAERERGITIQSAAVQFPWISSSSSTRAGQHPPTPNEIALIDTPGHVDFSVEVNRSVAVLDGAVLVVDAVAGAQAQTETVWRALSMGPALNHHDPVECATKNLNEASTVLPHVRHDHDHQPLSCIAVVNKMDKVGSHFGQAVKSMRDKLPGANPVPIQIAVFHKSIAGPPTQRQISLEDLVADEHAFVQGNTPLAAGDFAGVIDLVHWRVVVWPDTPNSFAVEDCIPTVLQLPSELVNGNISRDRLNCPVTKAAWDARQQLAEALANVDEELEELFLLQDGEEENFQPTTRQLVEALRRTTLRRTVVPVLASAALKGKGVELILDAIAEYLPSPLDRLPPPLTRLDEATQWDPTSAINGGSASFNGEKDEVKLGHSLHSSLLALAFKVVHMKGRGGSGDGRVVFCRVYSGNLRDRDQVQVLSPPAPGEVPQPPRTERVGGMLELAGGRFGNLANDSAVAYSGEVCALVGLKSVVTGDTLLAPVDKKKRKKNNKASSEPPHFLAGVAAPKPVLTVRLEAETAQEQSKLSHALALMAIEDPSLIVEETESSTLLSGLGELHIEVILDRIQREQGLRVLVGAPSVTYRETVMSKISSEGYIHFDRTIGDTRMQASVDLTLEPDFHESTSSRLVLTDPIVTLGPAVRAFLGLGEIQTDTEDEFLFESELANALIQGCKGALKCGPLSSYPMANIKCCIRNIDAEGGLPSLAAMPGSLRAAAANAVMTLLNDFKEEACSVLEPTMSIEINLPNDLVGNVLSDLTGRRGSIGDVILDDNAGPSLGKALIRGDVPLIEILGYANALRSLTGGEASFSAEYHGHSPCKPP